MRKVPLQVLDMRTPRERHADLVAAHRIAVEALKDIADKGDPLATVARRALHDLGLRPVAVAEACT